MERDKIIHLHIKDLVRDIYRKEGPRAFFDGLGPSVIGIIPYHGTGFFMYHMLKRKLMEEHPDWKQSKFFDFLFGGIAGVTAQIGKYGMLII